MIQPHYKFHSLQLHKIWGGSRLARFKDSGENTRGIGESWELADMGEQQTCVIDGPDAGLTLHELMVKYGEALTGATFDRFPLLIKYIDAGSNLSVQVHPDQEMAARRALCSGKNEVWYIISAEPGAKIYSGLKHNISPDDYERMVHEKTVMDAVAVHDAHPGDVFYIPAGRVHAIGAGIMLAEIQQPSDVTYRIYDYDRLDADGKKRELHTDLAREALDYNIYDSYTTDYDREREHATLISCPSFTVERIKVNGQSQLGRTRGTFMILMCIEGAVELPDGSMIKRGDTLLIPAASDVELIRGKATVLTATV